MHRSRPVRRRSRNLVLTAFLACACSLHAQSAPAATVLGYDVSTVKPHDAGDKGMSWGTHKDSMQAKNVALAMLIASAWGVRPDQVTGEPAWADDDRWDVTGKVTEGDAAGLNSLKREDSQRMLQGLLRERFGVKAHVETRTGPVFHLVVAKGGLKLTPLPPPKEDEPKPEYKPGVMPDPDHMPRGSLRIGSTGGAWVMQGYGVNIGNLAGNIANNLGQTVLDETGIPADEQFNFKLTYARETVANGTADSDAPPMREALEQQLGLHLEATRGPVEVVVVDHVEKPTAN